MTNKTVLVTGGNGHLGNTLAKALCDKGYQVRVTVRDLAKTEDEGIFAGYSVELHQADMRDAAAISAAMQDVAGVFQVAALYHYDEQSVGEGIVANNTDGCLTVLRAAKEAGVERVVLTSSIVAIGFGGTAAHPMTEESWSDPQDPYCRSKLESEQAAWQFAQEHGIDLVTICPSLILGPNFYKHTASTVNVSAFINNQVPFRFPFETSIVDVRDVADAHILAYENKAASGRYLTAGTHIKDLAEILKEFDKEMHLPERVLSLEETKEFAEKSGAPVEMIGHSFRYSDARIQRELNWQPRSLADTLIDTIDWIKSRGM